MEENVSGCFFFWTQCRYQWMPATVYSTWSSLTHIGTQRPSLLTKCRLKLTYYKYGSQHCISAAAQILVISSYCLPSSLWLFC